MACPLGRKDRRAPKRSFPPALHPWMPSIHVDIRMKVGEYRVARTKTFKTRMQETCFKKGSTFLDALGERLPIDRRDDAHMVAPASRDLRLTRR